MNVKVIDILDALTEAVSATNYSIRSVLECAVDEHHAMPLSNDEYLHLAYACEAQEKIWKLLPAEIFTDEVKAKLSGFSAYAAKTDDTEGTSDLYDVKGLMNRAYWLHSAAHDAYETAQNAIKLYT
jgi:hypothetical protein